jgi:hypothetical protein
MEVIIAAQELPIPHGPNRNLAGLQSGNVTISAQPGESCTEYTMTFGDAPLLPEAAYKVMCEAAPSPAGDLPSAVVEDWAEPDHVARASDARARVDQHQAMLKEHWDDFMPARQLFMDIVCAVPELRFDEQEVYELITREKQAAFAAAYLIEPFNAGHALRVLNNTGIDQAYKDQLWDTVRARVQPLPVIYNGKERQELSTEGAQLASAEVTEELLALPPEVTDRIVQSTITPAIKEDFAWAAAIKDYNTENFPHELIQPPARFLRRYCVQATRGADGSVRAVPMGRQLNGNEYLPWLIPENDGFTEYERSGTVRDMATLVYPHDNRLAGHVGTAVKRGSIRAAPGAPLMDAHIRWKVGNDGGREFILENQVRNDKIGKIYSSGVFGVILTAALQPDMRRGWPTTMTNKEINESQEMGIAQLPILALMKRRKLAVSPLLHRAEQLVEPQQ